MSRRNWPSSDELQQEGSRTRLRVTALIHLALTLLLIAWNGLANAGILGRGVGEVSRNLDNIFTPASYAFSIWGPIYLGLIALGAYEVRLAWRSSHRKMSAQPDERFILALGHWFSLAQLVCGLWLVAWLTDRILLSLALMFLLLGMLLICVFRTNMERWHAPTSVIVLIWWPLSLYSGWISVAFLANLSAAMASENIALAQQSSWAYILIALVVLSHGTMVWWRNLREFSMVGVWALIALSVRYSSAPEQADLRLFTLLAAAALVLNACIHAALRFALPADLKRRFS